MGHLRLTDKLISGFVNANFVPPPPPPAPTSEINLSEFARFYNQIWGHLVLDIIVYFQSNKFLNKINFLRAEISTQNLQNH